jgi:lycopene cyclase-like protein
MIGHVAVVGAGPAGLSAAAELVDRGLTVSVVDPHPGCAWPARYGMWQPQAAELGILDAVVRSWRNPGVTTRHGHRAIDVPYVLIDNDRLRQRLLDRIIAGNGRVIAGRAAGLTEHPRRHLLLEGQAPIPADVVIDASGATPVLARTSSLPRSWQSAYGVLAEVTTHPWSADEMVLMDFRHRFPAPASFLYALPMGGQRVFLEETVLSSPQPLGFNTLAARLDERLDAMGIRIVRRLGEERVCIPMGQGLSPHDQPVVAFGAASGLMHPATGYSIAATLELAPVLAEAITAGLMRGDPDGATRDAWRAILPPARRRTHRLTRIGHQVFERLEADLLASALSSFFGQPQAWWLAFMSGTSGSLERLRGMVGTGLNLGVRHQARIARQLLSLGISPQLPLTTPSALIDHVRVGSSTEEVA